MAWLLNCSNHGGATAVFEARREFVPDSTRDEHQMAKNGSKVDDVAPIVLLPPQRARQPVGACDRTFVVPVLLLAQTTISTGSIVGTVTDPTGSVVSGAKVVITNKDTGQVITTTTTSAGTYTSGALTPGEYGVRVEAKGFEA